MKTSWLGLGVLVFGCAAEPNNGGGESVDSSSSGPEPASSTTDPSASTGNGESGAEVIDLGCENPQPILQPDGITPSGFVQCDDGFRHRAEAATCLVPDIDPCDSCASDCSELTLGRCVENPGLGSCSCVESCANDADCGENEACSCPGTVGGVPRCIPASCSTTADCGEGLCGISGSSGCEFDNSLACLLPSSECRNTTCEGDTECVCYASGGEYQCHDECFSGCG